MEPHLNHLGQSIELFPPSLALASYSKTTITWGEIDEPFFQRSMPQAVAISKILPATWMYISSSLLRNLLMLKWSVSRRGNLSSHTHNLSAESVSETNKGLANIRDVFLIIQSVLPGYNQSWGVSNETCFTQLLRADDPATDDPAIYHQHHLYRCATKW